MKKLLGTLAALVLLAAAYLLLWPVPIVPVAFTLAAAPGYVGVHATNTKLWAVTVAARSRMARSGARPRRAETQPSKPMNITAQTMNSQSVMRKLCRNCS